MSKKPYTVGNTPLQKLFAKEMTRKEFLTFTGILVASVFGIMGVIKELQSRAATPNTATEPEDGTLSGGATVVNDGAASGGKAVQFGGGTAHTPYLPIEITPAMLAAMKQSSRKVYPVGVITYQPSSNYIGQAPPGTNSPNPANGGTIRDLYVVDVDNSNATLAAADARAHESAWFDAAGLDAHTMDYFSATYNANMVALMHGAQLAGTKLIPQPDCSTSDMKGTPQESATLLLNYMTQYPSVWAKHTNGNYLLMPYRPEFQGQSPVPRNSAWWVSFKQAMASAGFPVSIIGCFQDNPHSAQNFPFFGAGAWGDPTDTALNSSNSGTAWAAYCRTNNISPYQWIRVGDDRPRENLSANSNGFKMFMNCWTAAESCDGAYLTTSNDFTEGGQITRTIGSGYGWPDLLAYYTAKFKLGANAVPIVRDGVYLMHRKQFSSWRGTQATAFNNWVIGDTSHKDSSGNVIRGSWRNTPDDKVYGLCFLTAPATVTIAGVSTTVPAGVTQISVPLVNGKIAATVVRGNQTVASVTSPHIVSNSGVSNKLQYVVSSFAGRAGATLPF